MGAFRGDDALRNARWAVVVGVVLAGPASLSAGWGIRDERSTRGPSILASGLGVRAEGLGGAYVAVADDASALAWNPAGVQQLQRAEAVFQHDRSWSGQTTDWFGWVRPVWRKGRRTGGLSAAYRAAAPVEVVVDDASEGRARPSEGLLAASWARPWGALQAGVTGKWVYQETYRDRAQSVALDVGVFQAGPGGRWGAALANLGPPLRPGGTKLPMVVRLGAARSLWEGRRGGFLSTAELDAPAADRPQLQVGVEYALAVSTGARVLTRMGYRNGGAWADRFTLGLGWRDSRRTLNYAFTPLPEAGSFHRFDVGWRFGNPLLQERRRDERWNEARTHVDAERWLKARDALAEVRRLDPTFYPARPLSREVDVRLAHSLDPETLFIQGMSALEAGEAERAADFLAKFLLIKPDHAEAREALRRAEKAMAGAREARVQVELAKESARERARLSASAMAAAEAGRWEEVWTKWARVLDLAPRDVAARDGLARARPELLARAAAALDKNDWSRVDELTDLLKKNTDDATRDFLKESARRRAIQAEAKYQEGLRAYAAGDRAAARRLFEDALAAAPGDKSILQALRRLQGEVLPSSAP